MKIQVKKRILLAILLMMMLISVVGSAHAAVLPCFSPKGPGPCYVYEP